MSSVYLVKFSEYEVAGAYTDEKTAELVRNLYHDAYIETINLNEIPQHIEGKVPWRLIYGKYNNYYSVQRVSIKEVTLRDRYVKSRLE